MLEWNTTGAAGMSRQRGIPVRAADKGFPRARTLERARGEQD